jgi:hypothetical protein
MSIRLRFYNFIIPKRTIDKKYKGGLNSFKINCPNRTFEEDNDLVSLGFMNPMDVKWFCHVLKKNGLQYNGKTSVDFVVTNSMFGNLWDVKWLDRDINYCWLKGKFPTHTNTFIPKFKKHKVFEEKSEIAMWWNNLNDAWKNILYYNHIITGEDKIKNLHNKFSFGYTIEYIGNITLDDIQKIFDIEEIWANASNCDDLARLGDLYPIKNLKRLKSLTLRSTDLTSLKGIEYLEKLEFIEIGGQFSDIDLISKLYNLKTVNLHSPFINSIKPLNGLNLTWLNINNGKIPDPNEFVEFEIQHPKCAIYKSFH